MNRNVSIVLIGLQANVVENSDPTMKSVVGKIVLETRNTLVLETSEGRKILPKKNAELEFSDAKAAKVDGSAIIGRPEERIAKLV
ncbi:MAG: ribonuclease P protein subunit [Thaumarchaeota archaeon]|uniref:Ribonuclease P protein component 1 n=1 Tax=uncultured thaumarchaeote Rifle_16ft_4_minimus_1872 TaxID=1665209 RepID=A0A0H4TLP3_9ARCH|nr:RNAse P subunit P29, ribonuclease P protein subunit POP4 [uncultured thaumarchaeote Rifle_16ft_4_minimus_1872]MCS4538030.1 ribonuclease P protein subunit [Nitrososphaerota archaeon]HKZ39459.1 ribonuclease P protein subunit [Candidatus Hodarchaeales archaeon]